MNSVSIFDELDQAIDRLLADPDAATADVRSGIAELMEVVPDLRHLPRADFKTRLMVELEWQTQGRAISAAPAQPAHAAGSYQPGVDLLPTLSGNAKSLYPVRGANFAASVALHAAMFLFVSLGLVMVKSTSRVMEPRVTSAILIHPYIVAGDGGGGGGAGDKVGASKGKAPRFAREQFAPPAVTFIDPLPRLPLEATLIGPPELNVPQAQMGDPLSNLLTLSSGAGVSGIGSGRNNGVGPGDGSGRGPGSGGGTGGNIYPAGNGVSAPRAIYDPEPDYSDEARAAKYQGVVVLALVVRPDGRPTSLRVARSLGMGLDEKALEAVRTWRFEPGRKDGHPVAVQIEVEVDFRLY
ncbi:MAG TPA: energy transducer TonB [Candidatus Angelobacter sp.]